ncbi:unnamed protein product [Coffea canephora]|uniref:Uncharacterized protein n=1 Tax=Coffea canephora TaxID=49390 RepID=A0A068UT46_COFCA|nr:unnamed protein product [Coffea canephora]
MKVQNGEASCKSPPWLHSNSRQDQKISGSSRSLLLALGCSSPSSPLSRMLSVKAEEEVWCGCGEKLQWFRWSVQRRK